MSMLGSKVKDLVSGFEGTVLGEAQYLYSVSQLFVVPYGLKDGRPIDGVWFDHSRLVEVKEERKAGF